MNTPISFDVLKEIEGVRREIKLVLDGTKIDRLKMLTIFNMVLIANN